MDRIIEYLEPYSHCFRRGGDVALKNKRILYGSIFFGLLVVEVCIALFVHDSFVRLYVGDMLVTLLLCCLCRVVVPSKIRLLPLFVFIFAACVEIGQYFDLVSLLGLANNRFLSTVLGRTFSWLDLLCYGTGCVAAFLLDQIIHYDIRKA